MSKTIIEQESRSSSFPRLRTNQCLPSPGNDRNGGLGERTYIEHVLCTGQGAGTAY